MILMRANPIRVPLERVSPENWDFFGPWNGNERAKRVPFGAKNIKQDVKQKLKTKAKKNFLYKHKEPGLK